MTEIKHYFPNTYALVMCGGNSSRMGADKSMITYYDKPQRNHVYDMLQPFCEKVLISCNEKQSNEIEAGYEFIKDDEEFGDIGPMAALLTACVKYPRKNILLIGCDYPFLTAIELEKFSSCCKDTAAAFYNEEDAVYEPMLAWYPYNCFNYLKEMHTVRQFSLQQLLRQRDAVKYLPVDTNSIKSIDTIEAFNQTIAALNAR